MRCPRCEGQVKGRPGLCPKCRKWLDANHPIAVADQEADPWMVKMANQNVRSAHVLLDTLIGLQLGHLSADRNCPDYCLDGQVICELELRTEEDLRMLLFAAIRSMADAIHRKRP